MAKIPSVQAEKQINSKQTALPYADVPLFHFSTRITKDFLGKKIKGVIFGNFGAMNYGDEAILAGQLDELKKIENVSITVVSRFPEQITKLYKIKTVNLVDLRNVFKTLFDTDFVIVGGGGLFCKNDAGIKGLLFQLYTTLAFLALPLFLRKKVYVLGIGFYSNTNTFVAKIAQLFLRFTSIVTVRDQHSYDYLKSQGVTVSFYKDNSFLMELLPVEKLKSDPFFASKIAKTKYHVGIALKKGETDTETKKIIDETVTCIVENVEDATFWFYALDAHTLYYNDEKFAQDIITAVKKKTKKNIAMYILPTDWHPGKLFASFQLMDYIIAMRLHASIFCYRTKTPFFAISYDEKCSSFLASIHKSFVSVSDISSVAMQKELSKIKK